MSGAARIAVLSSDLADQIAAGEVVERPASVVKELVENAIDAGATHVDVELTRGGLERIRVVDDGRGIHPDDLELAVTRHATSKVRRPEDLVEIGTLGFRGEALASVAAVATFSLRSRRPADETGYELRGLPGQAAVRTPMGMPVGTQIDVEGLFAAVPARRKFLRSEATEAAQCSEAILRIGLVHPGVQLRLTNGGRELVSLARGSRAERVAQVLRRRGAGELLEVAGEYEGVTVRAWIADPSSATRGRNAVHVVVRRRVVKERAISQIVGQALGPHLPPGLHPIACVFVEPPEATVDVNVHPQKSEVRFSSPQAVFAAVRHVLHEGLAAAHWAPPPGPPPPPELPGAVASPGSTYRLGTRALDSDYGLHKDRVRSEAADLRATTTPGPEPRPDEPSGPTFLACLPGPVGLFAGDGSLYAVDLLRLRSHLVHRRLQRALGGGGSEAQRLMTPVVVPVAPAEVELVASQGEALQQLGLDCEPFGDDAVMVRGVPAALAGCVEEADVRDLVERVLPWLRLHARGSVGLGEGVDAIAGTRGADPAPRLARRWLRELVERGEALERVPGIRRWDPGELVGGEG